MDSKTLRRDAYRFVGGAGVLATADPADIAWVLPRRVLRNMGTGLRARLNVQFFPSGPWDLAAEPFRIHRYVKELFVDGVAVRDSRQYHDMIARLSDPGRRGSVWGCRSVADVDRYFERLQAMYEDMRDHGYRSHIDLGTSPHDEVKVRIGRDGRIIKCSGGNHRVSLAKLLHLDRIPVLVCGIHKDNLRRVASATVHKDPWCPATVAETLDDSGLHRYQFSHVEEVSRRFRLRSAYRSVADLPRRGRVGRPDMSENSVAILGLLDDVNPSMAQSLIGPGLLSFLGA